MEEQPMKLKVEEFVEGAKREILNIPEAGA